ncbi:MAG: hypothetical protein M1831_002050 [Alyxoria varia]|nr:MAG: hypothetical protein M1831_002050 [Alyxoria varia]
MLSLLQSNAAVLLLLATTVFSAPNPEARKKDKKINEPNLEPKVNWALKHDFADPAVIKDGDTWYSFATGRGIPFHVQVATSKDFKNWTRHTDEMLPKTGEWTHKQPITWAPYVAKHGDGKYIMYYSARTKKNGKYHCVGVAESDKIMGPYVPHKKPFVCPLKEGGAIDASSVVDVKDKQRYVLYKIDGNTNGNGGVCGNTKAPIKDTPIMIQPVENDGYTKKGKPTTILHRGKKDGPLVEAPQVIQKDGKYILFFSSNCYATEWYDIAYAFADKITGPYTKYGPLAISGTQGLRSPGGASVTEDGTKIAFHGYTGHGTRGLYTANINIDTKKHEVTFV